MVSGTSWDKDDDNLDGLPLLKAKCAKLPWDDMCMEEKKGGWTKPLNAGDTAIAKLRQRDEIVCTANDLSRWAHVARQCRRLHAPAFIN